MSGIDKIEKLNLIFNSKAENVMNVKLISYLSFMQAMGSGMRILKEVTGYPRIPERIPKQDGSQMVLFGII